MLSNTSMLIILMIYLESKMFSSRCWSFFFWYAIGNFWPRYPDMMIGCGRKKWSKLAFSLSKIWCFCNILQFILNKKPRIKENLPWNQKLKRFQKRSAVDITGAGGNKSTPGFRDQSNFDLIFAKSQQYPKSILMARTWPPNI